MLLHPARVAIIKALRDATELEGPGMSYKLARGFSMLERQSADRFCQCAHLTLQSTALVRRTPRPELPQTY